MACSTFLSVRSASGRPRRRSNVPCKKPWTTWKRTNLAGDIEEGLKPRGTGVDEAGRTFRERIEVTLEDDGPEWDEEEGELDFWRARGKVRAVDIVHRALASSPYTTFDTGVSFDNIASSMLQVVIIASLNG
jgi:hypothetical protein